MVDADGVARSHPERGGDEMKPRQRSREAQPVRPSEQRFVRHDDANGREKIQRHERGRLQVLVAYTPPGFHLWRGGQGVRNWSPAKHPEDHLVPTPHVRGFDTRGGYRDPPHLATFFYIISYETPTVYTPWRLGTGSTTQYGSTHALCGPPPQAGSRLHGR